MGQSDIYNLLCKNRQKKFSISDLTKKLKTSKSSISSTLVRMDKCQNVYNLKYDYKKGYKRVWIK